MTSSARRCALLLTSAALLAACSGTQSQGVTPDDLMTLAVANGLSVPIDLTVNGTPLTRVPPHTSGNFNYELLRSLPWHVEAATVGGRTLLTLDVHSGDVRDTASGSTGDGARADLSCGRLDMYSGPPMAGPVPGPGVPGDCSDASPAPT